MWGRQGKSLVAALLTALLCLWSGAARAAEEPGDITLYNYNLDEVRALAGGVDGAIWFQTGVFFGYVVPGSDLSRRWSFRGFPEAAILLAPDGAIWVSGLDEHFDGFIGPINDEGQVTKYLVPGMFMSAPKMTAGDDGNVWVIGRSVIGPMTPDGIFTSFASGGDGSATDIAAGPDGRVWFIRYWMKDYGPAESEIAAMTESGEVQAYSLPNGYQRAQSLTLGADGNMWFAVEEQDPDHPFAVVKMTPTGKTEVFSVPQASYRSVRDMAVGPDGRIWLTTAGPDLVTRVDLGGTMTQFALPELGSGPVPIAVGPDGGMWFGRPSPVPGTGLTLGRIATGVQSRTYAPVLVGSGRVGQPLTCRTPSWPQGWTTDMEWVRDGWTIPWSEETLIPSAADEDHEFACIVSAWRDGILSPLMAFSDAVVVEDPPSVTSISPQSGQLQGGTSVIVQGTGFRPLADVRIGSKECLDVVDSSRTELTCITPPGLAAGSVEVTVVNPSGLSGSLPAGFTYLSAPTPNPTPTPTVTAAAKATWRKLPKRVRVRTVLAMTIRATSAGTATVTLKGPSSAKKVKSLPAGDTQVRWRLPKKVKAGRYKATLLFNGVVTDIGRLRVVANKRK